MEPKNFPCDICKKSFSKKFNFLRHRKVHGIPFERGIKKEKNHLCDVCGKGFTMKNNLIRHRKVHGIVTLRRPYNSRTKAHICDICGKGFSWLNNLVRHRKDHEVESTLDTKDTKNHRCDTCENCYTKLSSLNRHRRQAHGVVSTSDTNVPYNYVCDLCGLRFANKYSLSRHRARVHGISKTCAPKAFPCNYCEKSYNREGNLRSHQKKAHQMIKRKFILECDNCLRELRYASKKEMRTHLVKCLKKYEGKLAAKKRKHLLKCALCATNFRFRAEILDHYQSVHKKNVSFQSIEFENQNDFEIWKEKNEQSMRCTFSRSYGRKTKKVLKEVWACNRSGYYEPQGTKRIRKLGTKKINAFCPAVIKKKLIGNRISVNYIFTHVGHECNNKLAYMTLTAKEKNEILSKLEQGISPRDILKSMKHPLPKSEEERRRIHLLTIRDIRNIAIKYGLWGREKYSTREKYSHQKNSALGVSAWVLHNKESVLYYKKQGEEDGQFQCLNHEDFVLVIMTQGQRHMWNHYGQNVIAIDSRHGVNGYDFQLTTAMVLDNSDRGYPVCFMFSNRIHEPMLQVMFKFMKLNIDSFGCSDCPGCLWQVNTFISDVDDYYYDAWNHVFLVPKIRLHCCWHVLREWKEYLNNISLEQILENNTETRVTGKQLTEIKKQVYSLVESLMYELDEQRFAEELENFLPPHPVLQFFQQYFMTYYEPRKQYWAYAFRKNAGISVNMILETFRETLKYSFLKKKKVKRLDTALEGVLEYLNFQKETQIIQEEIGCSSLKPQPIKDRHDQSRNENFEILMLEGEDGCGWVTKSFGEKSDANPIHFIQQIKQSCECSFRCAECDVCVHLFRCTCYDHAVQNNMCKHIHLLSKYFWNKVMIPEEDIITISEENIIEIQEDNIILQCDESIYESQENVSNPTELDAEKQKLRALMDKLMNDVDSLEEVSRLKDLQNQLRNALANIQR